MFEEQDERDENLDDQDADLGDENSDDEAGDGGDDADKDDDADDSEDEDESDKDDTSEEDKKPATIGDLKKLLKGNQNKSNAQRRIDSKNGRNKNQNTPKINSRLDAIEQSQAKAVLLERKRQFGHENNLSPKEVDVVFRLSKRPTAKFLKEPEVAGAIGAIRAAQKVRDNTPGGSGKTPKTPSQADWIKLKPAERQSSFADRRRAILDAKRNK